MDCLEINKNNLSLYCASNHRHWEFGYRNPVIQRAFAKAFWEFLETKEPKDKLINLFGSGGSGTCLVTACSVLAPKDRIFVPHFVLIPNHGGYELRCHDIDNPDDREVVNIVIDDHYSTGQTLSSIQDLVSLMGYSIDYAVGITASPTAKTTVPVYEMCPLVPLH